MMRKVIGYQDSEHPLQNIKETTKHNQSTQLGKEKVFDLE